ncbi:MAG: radical SAM protein [Myxococcales bacterium]|nr:radical SAM protein [Myxococcales bacterium]
MDLRAHLLALLAPHRVGDPLIPGVVIAGASTELGLRLKFEVDGQPLWVDVDPLSRVERYAARSERLAFGYRTEGERQSLDPQLGRRICEATAALARANEGRVLAAVEEERVELPDRELRVRRVTTDALLERTGVGGVDFYTLSPYVGCVIGCKFCYAQVKVGAMRELLRLPQLPWGSYVDARVNAHEVVARELAALPVLPIKFCPVVSDPYQALERRERLTRRCLEAIRDAPRVWPTLLLTRSSLVLDDLALLAQLPRAQAGVSIPTIDDDVRARFEPRAAPIPARLEILAALRRAGVPSIAVVQPLLSGSVDALADALAERADSVSIDILRGELGAAEEFARPEFRESSTDRWQRDRARALAEALARRGVPVWSTELPPAFMPGLDPAAPR